MSTWRLRLFGTFALEGPNGTIRHFGTTRAAKLLALVALSRRGVMRREELADCLWPDDYYDATRLRLRQEIHRLRTALGEAADLIAADPREVRVDLERLQTDFQLLERGELLPEAVLDECFLPGWDEPQFHAERQGASTRLLHLATDRAERLFEEGRVSEALQIAQRITAKHPCHEPITLLAVKAHAKLGSLSSAVTEYQSYRRSLKLREAPPSEAMDRTVKQLLEEPTPTEAFRAEIPLPVEPLFGRTQELEEFAARLAPESPERIVTLVGPGGIGKTRLSLEILRCLRDAYLGRTAFVSLAELSDPAEFSRVVLARVGMHAPAGIAPEEYLLKALGSPPALLVLDNLETLLPALAEPIRALSQAYPNLRLLLTSRVPVKIPGEKFYPIGSIEPIREGVAMLRHAASEGRFGVTFDESQLCELAKKLDGYPLALRLAGSRLKVTPPEILTQEIEEKGLRLTSRSADLPERHRSFESVLESSIQALTGDDLEALKRLCAFPGGAGYRLAIDAINRDDSAEVLERLVESSLLAMDDRGPDVRFRVRVPVREYVLHHEDTVERESQEAAAAQAILANVRRIRSQEFGPITEPQLRALDQEYENIVAAYDWFLTHDHVGATALLRKTWAFENLRARQTSTLRRIQVLPPDPELAFIEGALWEGLTDVPKGLEAIERASTGNVEVELVRSALRFRLGHGLFADELPRLSALVQVARSSYATALLDFQVGIWHYFLRRHDESERALAKCFEALVELGDLQLGGRCGLSLAMVHNEMGRTFMAKQVMERARPLAVATKDPLRMAFLHECEGRLWMSEGRYQEAEAAFTRSFEAWSLVNSAFQMADQLHSINRARLAQGRYLEAAEALRDSAELWYADRNQGGLCQAMTSAAVIRWELGDHEGAARVLGYMAKFERNYDISIVLPEAQFRDAMVAKCGLVEPEDVTLDPLEAVQLLQQTGRASRH